MDYTNYWPYVYNPYQMGMAFPLAGTVVSQQQCIQADINLMQKISDSISMANAMVNSIPPAMPEPKDIQRALYDLAFPEDPIRDYFGPIIKRIEREMLDIEKSYSRIFRGCME